MFPKLVGFRKKWSKFLFIATANLYFKVLNESAHLSLLMESDGIMIYKVVDFVQELSDNLTDLSRSEDYDFLPFHVDEIGTGDRLNLMLEDSMKTQVSVSAGTVKVAKRMKLCQKRKEKLLKQRSKLLKKSPASTMLKQEKKQLKDVMKSLFQLLLKKLKRDFPCLRVMNHSKRLEFSMLVNGALVRILTRC